MLSCRYSVFSTQRNCMLHGSYKYIHCHVMKMLNFVNLNCLLNCLDRHNDDNVEFLKDEDFVPKSRVRATQHVVRPVSDFTEEDLLMVADAVSDKRYDSVNGTSCHQCHQKTDDLKTVCRNENCIGIRGQFCGPCLRNRYGESVKEAIMDPAWICPPCRGICNCSFCMKKRGSFCTGQLINLAREHGFNDVRTFLGD